MTEELEKLRTEFNERIDALLKPNPQFEVGKWYKETTCYAGKMLVNVLNVNPTSISCYGFDGSGVWFNKHDDFGTSGLVPATPEEVKQALVKEAERRGFKEGVKFKTIDGSDRICTVNGCHKLLYSEKYDSLHAYTFQEEWSKGGKYISSNPEIYKQGQWAEIIPQEEVIKIGGYEVKFHKGDPNDYYTTIDGHEFSCQFWLDAKGVAQHSKAAVWVGCDAKKGGSYQWMVELSTINSILNKLK